MMAVVFDNSNQNCGSAVGVGGVERIAFNLIIRLLLVYNPLLIFGVRS